MKTKLIQLIGLSLSFIMVYSGSINLFAQSNSEGGTSSQCFSRTTTDCAKVVGQGGAQKIVCDLTGIYVKDAECTTINCIGIKETITCTKSN